MAFDPRERFAARNTAIRAATEKYTTHDDLKFATVPTVDLSPLLSTPDSLYADPARAAELDACVEALRAAAAETGFFYAVHHGIPKTVAQAYMDATGRLFDRSAGEKATCTGAPNGYFAKASENFSKLLGRDGTPDMREGWRCGPTACEDFPEDRRLPAEDLVPGFAEAVNAHYEALTRMDARLCKGFSLALGREVGQDLPHTWMSERVGRHRGLMTAHRYPEMKSAPPNTNRIAAHADLSMFSILRTDGQPGLEVLQDGEWRRLPPAPPDALVVNVGDMLQMWSNDHFNSSVHRVATPLGGCPRRQSWGWFAAQALAAPSNNAPAEHKVAPLLVNGEEAKYPAYTAREYLATMLEALARLQPEKETESAPTATCGQRRRWQPGPSRL